MDKFCEWEWVSTSAGVVQTGCSVEGAVLVGNYSYHECGIQVTVGPGHRGCGSVRLRNIMQALAEGGCL